MNPFVVQTQQILTMQSPINLQEKPRLINVGRCVHMGGAYKYVLPKYWSLHLYEYQGKLWVNEKPFEIYPGCLTLVPPGLAYRYLIPPQAMHYFVHFALPALPLSDSQASLIPIIHDVRGDLYHFEQSLITMGRAFFYSNNLSRAEVKLWDLLWEVEAHSRRVVALRHPCIDKILALIDAKLGKDISVAVLAREVGLSRTHLARLFQQEKGLTILAYVRQQRAQRAKYLLEHTTLSLSSIATEINAPNLQSFSKLLSKETGHSPSYWRRQPQLHLTSASSDITRQSSPKSDL